MNKKTDTDIGEDIVIEEEFSEDSHIGDKYQDKIDALKKKLDQSQADKEEYLQGWQRAQADFINYKKNNDSVYSLAREEATVSLVESLLPVLDSFEMALKGTFDDSFQKWLTGFEYIHMQLKKVLEENGIEEINPLNQTFSPDMHEALEEVSTDDETLDHKVAHVILKGYKTSKRIIRAAQVKVYKSDK